MNQGISEQKLFEMYGKISLERDLMREQLQQMQDQVKKQPPKEGKKTQNPSAEL